MPFGPKVRIDLTAWRHNLGVVRKRSPGKKIWAVIKANAYGHGIEQLAADADLADGIAVARLDEAIGLRRLGVNRPILLLEGVFTASELNQAIEYELQLVVHQEQQIELLADADESARLKVWLKVDTGMHRLGFRPVSVETVKGRLAACRCVAEVNLMSHLANADHQTDPKTRQQLDTFNQLAQGDYPHRSLSNSAAIMSGLQADEDWVRPGIMLYGASPLRDQTAPDLGLRPVMTFTAPVLAVNQCDKGDRIGYGGIYQCPEDMPVAVIGVGYGDGYPRHAPSGAGVMVRDSMLPLTGRVSMDMISVDARALPDLQVGDEALLWGAGLPAEHLAERAGTIAYELFCGITARVNVEYISE